MKEQREGRTFLVYAAILLVATVAIIVLLKPGAPERAVEDRRDARDAVTETTAPPRATKPPKARPTTKSTELPANFGSSFPGLGTQPGLDGEGRSDSLPKHKITIRWSSPAGLGTIAYIVPTSTSNKQGSRFVRGSSWTETITAYGNPDYAVAFVQAAADGVPATCEITVDGKVTDRRSTEGPYGTVWCQG